ncbi:MAG: NADH-quinone oxidoreductase subunit NuoH [Chloroflexota bacterium]|nr:NADH-quinone oxidoreductase subunit NuoH [Chloroflexota bacterium]
MTVGLLSIITGYWFDIRDLSNLSRKIEELIGDAGGPHWLIFVVSALLGAGGIVAFIGGVAIINIWVERRVVGRMQSRLGPNRLGPFGLLQPVADAIKLMQKEVLQPTSASGMIFTLAPIMFTVPGIWLMAVLPWGRNMTLATLDVGVLFLLAASSLGALAVFMAGYSSNNKYALFGSMRVIAMLVSYEIPIVLALLGVVLFAGTMDLEGIVLFQEKYWAFMVLLQPLPFFIYFISVSAELNRTPADIAEAESEIVGGYHTEYSGMKFGLFYAAELINAVVVSAIISTLFLGGWWMYKLDELVPGWMIYVGKIYGVYFLFVWTRGTLPRFRIDQLLAFAWKWMTPMAIINIVLVAAEVLIWEESGWSAGLLIPVYILINNALAGVVIYGFMKLLSPKFQRFPERLRFYGNIDVPSLPAVASLDAVSAGSRPS